MKANNGLLLVDKPSGMTSHDVVGAVRRIFKTREVGHSGTLDPMASGLMVLLLGEATKLSSYITDGDKEYIAQLRMGVSTDTLDITGNILSEKPVHLSQPEIERIALNSTADREFEVPIYSAMKVNGQKLYEYARSGEAVEIPRKKMKFWNIQNHSQEGILKFSLECSKGSFIRSWALWVGEQCGCGAVLSGLRRTKSHRFSIENAHTLESLQRQSELDRDSLQDLLLPIGEALPGTPMLKVKGRDQTLLQNGQISHDLRALLISRFNPDLDTFIWAMASDESMMALIALEPQVGFKIRRVFHLK